MLESSRTLLAASLGVAAGAALGAWLGRGNALLRLRLRLAAALARTVVLSNVRVPLSLLPPESRERLAVDAEGLVLCDVSLTDGTICGVGPPASSPASGLTTATVDGGGAVLVACWADAHTHLVKTHAHPRTRNPTGSISDALAVECEDQPRWAACPCCRPIAFGGGGAKTATADGDVACVPCPRATDVERRMEFAIASAYHHGTRAMRTHLDGTNSPDPKLRATVYAAFAACRARWAARGLELQGVANLYLPLWREAALAQSHADEAAAVEGVILGAYCGNVADTPDEETAEALDSLFGHARRLGLQVDVHIDETNEPRCCCLLPLVGALGRARAAGYTLPVVLGHCTSLALQSDATKRAVISGLKGLGAVSVVCNPATNLGLQDRRGSAAPHCAPIASDTPRTPLWRGLAPIQELEAAGVRVAAASDNVRDWWHAYGDYDGLATWKGAITLGQLDTAPCEGAWAHVVSDAAAAAMGVADGAAFAPGARADLILFPGARRLSELLSRPQSDRLVLRGGRVQQSRLPRYEELDDIVGVVTTLPEELGGAGVQRGATAVGA